MSPIIKREENQNKKDVLTRVTTQTNILTVTVHVGNHDKDLQEAPIFRIKKPVDNKSSKIRLN